LSLAPFGCHVTLKMASAIFREGESNGGDAGIWTQV